MTDKFFSADIAALIEAEPSLDDAKRLAREAVAAQPNARKLNALRANLAISSSRTKAQLLTVVWGFMMSYDGYKVMR
jgi:hypothetical protein